MKYLKYSAVWLMSIFALFSPLGEIPSSLSVIPLLWGETPLIERFYANNKVVVEERDPELTELIEKIAFCESGGREDVEIVDSNGYYSRGIMQFQMRTFETALRDLGYAVGDHETLRQQMLDGDYAKKVAYEWIEQDQTRLGHWTCYKVVSNQ